jgi:hypothetical protein
MRYLENMTTKRLTRFLVAGTLVGLGTPLLLGAGNAHAARSAPAATCVADANCVMAGTLDLGTGTLTLTTPDTLTWGGTVTGLDQGLVDTNLADQTYQVTDARGDLTAGWIVNVAATTFIGGTTGFPLPDTGTFSTNGSVDPLTGLATDPTAPTAACAGGSTCTLPSNSTTYPVPITTDTLAPTPAGIYDNAAGSGLGTINIGSVGWWLTVPGNAPADTYTSTIDVQVTSGP